MSADARAADRRLERAEFLAEAGWSAADAVPLAGDASTRSYERLTLNGSVAVLMNAPPRAEAAACPPDATPEQRRALGYNAMARLAGPNLNAFVAIAAVLRGAGLSAPEVYVADAARGFALIEDLGDALFARAVAAGADEATLYAAAIDALVTLRAQAPRPPAGEGYVMLDYDRTAMEAEIMLAIDWYYPFVTGRVVDDALRADYLGAFAPALGALSAPGALVLRDFHAENLVWLEGRDGPRRAGLLDFQDGLVGHAAYDLVSLLEDARRDVSPDVARAMTRRYCEHAARLGGFDEAAFLADCAVLAAQRNAKILGIFARLVKRDNKPRYADLLPRVEAHMRRDLSHPLLAPAARLLHRLLPERF